MSVLSHINPPIKPQIFPPCRRLTGILLQIHVWDNDSISTSVMPKAKHVFVKVSEGTSSQRHSMLVSYL